VQAVADADADELARISTVRFTGADSQCDSSGAVCGAYSRTAEVVHGRPVFARLEQPHTAALLAAAAQAHAAATADVVLKASALAAAAEPAKRAALEASEPAKRAALEASWVEAIAVEEAAAAEFVLAKSNADRWNVAAVPVSAHADGHPGSSLPPLPPVAKYCCWYGPDEHWYVCEIKSHKNTGRAGGFAHCQEKGLTHPGLSDAWNVAFAGEHPPLASFALLLVLPSC
jgi:hypothetical protein